jgi:hypothetical protein
MFHDCPFLKFGFQVPVRQNFCCPRFYGIRNVLKKRSRERDLNPCSVDEDSLFS